MLQREMKPPTSYTFTFRNRQTGELRTANSFSLNNAARELGIPVPCRGKQAEPWTPWECWERSECIWHYTSEGKCKSGPRGISE